MGGAPWKVDKLKDAARAIRNLGRRVETVENSGYIDIARQSGDVTIGTNYGDLTGMTITVLEPGTYMVVAVLRIENTTLSNECLAQLLVDGTAQGGEIQFLCATSGDGLNVMASGLWRVTTTKRNTVVKMQAKETPGGAGAMQVKATNSALAIFGFPGASAASAAGAGVSDHGDLTGVTTNQHHNEAHGSSVHTENGNWKAFYSDGSGDQQEVALGADGTVLASAGAAAAPVMEAIYTTHIATFQPITEALASGALWPTQGFCVGESGEHGALTAIRAKAVCGTAGAGTNTIVVEADDNPAFSSAVTLYTLALNTSTEVDDTVLDNTWAAGDIFVRARCTAVDATAPEEVVVTFYFKEQAENF